MTEELWEPSESDLTWVRDILPKINIDGEWICSFAVFRRSGEKELTLITRIYDPRMNTDRNIARVKKAVEAIGWTYKEAETVHIIGVCINGKHVEGGKKDGG